MVPHALFPPLKCSKICTTFFSFKKSFSSSPSLSSPSPFLTRLWRRRRPSLPEPRCPRRWLPETPPNSAPPLETLIFSAVVQGLARFPVVKRCYFGEVLAGIGFLVTTAARHGPRRCGMARIVGWMEGRERKEIRREERRGGGGKEKGEKGRGILAKLRHKSWSTSTMRIVHEIPCIGAKPTF